MNSSMTDSGSIFWFDSCIPDTLIHMSITANLNEAFAGESQASQKYRAFARRAEQDGLPNVARLFRAAADAENIHAQGHFRTMDGVNATRDNLQAAIAGETYEFTTMYPPMLAEAQAEGHRAQLMFRFAMKAEAVHAELYKQRPGGGGARSGSGRGQFLLVPGLRQYRVRHSAGYLSHLRHAQREIRRGGINHRRNNRKRPISTGGPISR